jgi:hypothetical protein
MQNVPTLLFSGIPTSIALVAGRSHNGRIEFIGEDLDVVSAIRSRVR